MEQLGNPFHVVCRDTVPWASDTGYFRAHVPRKGLLQLTESSVVAGHGAAVLCGWWYMMRPTPRHKVRASSCERAASLGRWTAAGRFPPRQGRLPKHQGGLALLLPSAASSSKLSRLLASAAGSAARCASGGEASSTASTPATSPSSAAGRSGGAATDDGAKISGRSSG